MESSTGESRSRRVCLTCGQAGCTIHGHHPASAYNVAEITEPACTPGCHELLTEKQLAAGVKLDRRLDRSETERRWALLQGVADVVGLLARNRGLLEVAAVLAQAGPSLGRVLATLAPAEWSSRTGAAGDVGPDPRASDRRQAVRERRGDPLPTVADDQPAADRAEVDRSEHLVELLAQTEQRLFVEDVLAGIDLPVLLMRLGELAERGALDRIVEWGRRMAPEYAAALARLRSAAGSPAMGDALEATAWLSELYDAAIGLLAGIASAEDVDRAEGLVDAFMEAWPPVLPAEL